MWEFEGVGVPFLKPETRNLKPRAGFTLLELLVVLAIMVVMSAVVLTAIGPALAEARVRAGARLIVAQLRYARSLAITSRTETAVSYDSTRGGLSVLTQSADADGNISWQSDTTQAGRFRTLPDEVTVADITLTDPASEVTGPVTVNPFTSLPTVNPFTSAPTGNAAPDASANRQLITFTALGQGEDARITLKDAQGHQRILQVDALTGRCDFVDANDSQTTSPV